MSYLVASERYVEGPRLVGIYGVAHRAAGYHSPEHSRSRYVLYLTRDVTFVNSYYLESFLQSIKHNRLFLALFPT